MTEEKGRSPGLIILLLAVVSVFIIVVVIILFPPGGGGDGNGNGTEETGPWRDLTKMKASLSEVTIFNFLEAEGPSDLDLELNSDDTVYMLIGLQDNLTSEDIVSIKDFAERGGKVIVADDGVAANRLSNFMQGTSQGKVEFTGKAYLVDSLLVEGAGADPGWIYNIRFIKGYSLIRQNDPHIVLVDSPNGLIISGEGKPILTTTKNLTVIDMNENDEMDLQDDNKDIYAPYGPMAVEFNVGNSGGKITYFSSTGLFTDSMFSETENEGFIRDYIRSLIPLGGDVLLDNSKQTTSYSPHTAVIPS